MALKDSGNSGYLEKDNKRITIYKWVINDDHTFLLFSDDDNGFERDKKRQKNNDGPMFIASESLWLLTSGTRIVLRTCDDQKKKDSETIISEDIKCDVSGIPSPKEKRFKGKKEVWRIEFGDISSWTFKPHVIRPRPKPGKAVQKMEPKGTSSLQ